MQPFCHKLNESFKDKTVIAASCMELQIFILFNDETLENGILNVFTSFKHLVHTADVQQMTNVYLF